MESGRSVEISDIQLSLIMPTGEVVIGNKFNTVATLEYSGIYSCIGLVNGTTMMVSLQLIVYVIIIESNECNMEIASYFVILKNIFNQF